MNTDSSNHWRIYLALVSVSAVVISATWFAMKHSEADTITDYNAANVVSQTSPAHTGENSNNNDFLAIEEQLKHTDKRLDFMQNQLNEQIRLRLEQSEKLSLELSSLKRHQDALLSQQGGEPELQDAMNFEKSDPDVQQEKERALANQWYQEQVNLLEADLYGETVDETWSAQVEHDFRGAFDKHSGHYTLNDVTCGSSACRVTARMRSDTNNTDPRPRLDQLIYSEVDWEGQSLSELNEETGDVTVYLVREGVDMPFASGATGSN